MATTAPAVTLAPGDTQIVDAVATDPEGSVVAGQVVSWASSNAGVATVSPASGTSATVTAVAAGTAIITGTIAANPPAIPAQIQAQVNVTVVSQVARLELIPR